MRVTRAVVICLLPAVLCLTAPVNARASALTGSLRLTGYAPLYLPSVVDIFVQASPVEAGTVNGGGQGIAPGESVLTRRSSLREYAASVLFSVNPFCSSAM